MNSIHVLIGRYLDDLEERPVPFYEAMVEKKIIDAYMGGQIKADEFHYYCERFRRLAQRDVRRAA
ncbi:hypothetical protein [Pseudomonas massiliensis]|uniref:hypothetical protein n=1 Tax=Pseudomonas massiliensis TaxID=522492 RepID=UPI00058E11AD|nr:hypothetical protein [Pseudomonas massiliensis]